MAPRPIAPLRPPLDAKGVRVPASKSIANRELVLSAIAKGRSHVVVGPLDPGDDVHAMAAAIAALGHEVRWEGDRIDVTPGEHGPATIDAREAGTVARFGLALAALGDASVAVDGSARLRERPLAPLVAALRHLGATVDRDTLPLTIRGPLRGGSVSVPGGESSQFASALLLVAPRMTDGLRLGITGGLVSAPFVDVTVTALEARGVRVERPNADTFVVAPQQVHARRVVIPGDVTAASYPAAAAAILGGSVRIDGVDARVVRGAQGDARFFALIEQMGCGVERAHDGVRVTRRGPLHGIAANVGDCSDVFPTLAAIATQADGPTTLDGIGHTRGQESDRIAAVAAAIAALGGRATAYADAIRVEPSLLSGGVVDARGDHRIAMAFSVLGLLVPGVAIDGWESVSKTFPAFYDVLARLG